MIGAAQSFLRDARHAQIAALSTLIALGVVVFDFGIGWAHWAVIVVAALGTQFLATRILAVPFDWRSPMITSLSLTLLLRTDGLWMAALAAAVAIGSKFVLRVNGKHVFNPANFAIVTLSLASASAWISPGQWGAAGWLALLMAGAGLAVTGKAGRWDVSLAFLCSFAAILFARALWVGDPLAIPLHQLQSGALLTFAFFMISDPMTTPNHRRARVGWAALVAAIGAVIVFQFYRSDGVILALILASPLVPLLDRICPAERAFWRKTKESLTCVSSPNPSPQPPRQSA